jgi:hypothetical protein
MALSTRSTAQPRVDATRARQGRLGRPILFVLLISLLLVVVGFAAAWTWRAGDLASTEPNNAREKADAAIFHAPEPAPINTQPYQKETPPEANHTAPGPKP